jgi:hypothetical protein
MRKLPKLTSKSSMSFVNDTPGLENPVKNNLRDTFPYGFKLFCNLVVLISIGHSA